MSDAGVLITASDKGLVVFGPGGKVLWSRDDLDDLAPFNVTPIAGSPYLVVSEHEGKIPPKARLQIIEQETGQVAFLLTVEEKKKLLVGIDLTNGQEVGEIPMSEKEPSFMVDSEARRVYYFQDDKHVKAYDF